MEILEIWSLRVISLKFLKNFPVTSCRNKETEILKGQIDFLKDAIAKEEERAAELEMKSK